MLDFGLDNNDLDTSAISSLVNRTSGAPTFRTRPIGESFISGGPLARLTEAAMLGDPEAFLFEAVAAREALAQFKAVSNDTRIDRVLDAANTLGLGNRRFVRNASDLDKRVRGIIDLINDFLGITNPFGTDGSTTTTGPVTIGGDSDVGTSAAIKLSASLIKAKRGFVLGRNFEDITKLIIRADVVSGPKPTAILLNLRISALGFRQDSLNVPLEVTATDGKPAQNVGDPEIFDEPRENSFEIAQKQFFRRNDASSMLIALSPAPGKVGFGIDGLNVTVTLDVSGTVVYGGKMISLDTVTVADTGLSI